MFPVPWEGWGENGERFGGASHEERQALLK